jgi:hypothetical protein
MVVVKFRENGSEKMSCREDGYGEIQFQEVK